MELGRVCHGPLCKGKFYGWDQFDLKSDGLNGKNAVCKKCISFKKKLKRRAQSRLAKNPENFIRVIVGTPDKDLELETGEIIGKSIVTLLEQGFLK